MSNLAPNPPIILFHYPGSPYSMKILWAFSIKGLPYHSVIVKPYPPRPEIDSVVRGYRKIPVMMIGRDVYCDTKRILDALEEKFPTPSLYPQRKNGSTDKGLADMFPFWTDGKIFPLITSLIPWGSPPYSDQNFRNDRKTFANSRSLDPVKIASMIPIAKSQLAVHSSHIEQQFLDGREWILDTIHPGVADIHVAMNIWFAEVLAKSNGGAPDVWNQERFPKTFAWFGRFMKYMKERPVKVTKSSGEEAIKIARTLPMLKGFEVGKKMDVFEAGLGVTVTPDDTGRVPTAGLLVLMDEREVVIRQQEGEVEVDVHFPRLGFLIGLKSKASL